METCVFCDIIDGKAPVSTVYEDDIVIVIMNINPINTGHVMVIPKTHVANLEEMDEETGAYVFKIGMRTAQAIRKSGIPCEGINLFLADGKAAFQHIFHIHLHVIPRFTGDSFGLVADLGTRPPREELNETAKIINEAYQRI
jgi:histidine triad (HIT) family protein